MSSTGASSRAACVEQGCVCRAGVRVSSTGACVEQGCVCRAQVRVSSTGGVCQTSTRLKFVRKLYLLSPYVNLKQTRSTTLSIYN